MDASKLKGAELDAAVARSEEIPDFYLDADGEAWAGNRTYRPSTDWAIGGPIIERAPWCLPRVNANPGALHLGRFAASTPGGFNYYGSTPLIAAMRAFVAARRAKP